MKTSSVNQHDNQDDACAVVSKHINILILFVYLEQEYERKFTTERQTCGCNDLDYLVPP